MKAHGSEKKLAIITGAAGGIGHHLVYGFAQAGYRVCALDVMPQHYDEQSGIHALMLDLQDEQAVVDCFAHLFKIFGTPSVLINNAAAQLPACKLTELEGADFQRVIRTNVTGAFLCCREFVKHNKAASYGRIINIASTRYHQNEADFEAYGASKGGVVALTNSLCVSLAQTPITVNAISPGWIACQDYESLSAQDHAQHPSGRVGRPDDILRACIFLCGEENDFINGANLLIDGGMTKRMIYPADF